MYFWTLDSSKTKLIIFVDNNNISWWLGEKEEDAGYLAWLAEGNTPEEWQPDIVQPTETP